MLETFEAVNQLDRLFEVLNDVSRWMVLVVSIYTILAFGIKDTSLDQDGGPSFSVGTSDIRVGVVSDHIEVGEFDVLLSSPLSQYILSVVIVKFVGLTIDFHLNLSIIAELVDLLDHDLHAHGTYLLLVVIHYSESIYVCQDEIYDLRVTWSSSGTV